MYVYLLQHYYSNHVCVCVQAESPRLLQSMLAAVGDLYVYRVTKKLFDSTVAKYAVSCINTVPIKCSDTNACT